MAGKPAKFTGAVHITFAYIDMESPAYSPILNAVVGVVGVIKKSYFSKAATKSCLMRVLIFWAFR
jgi:xanthosine utilization system XapX-like protein